MRIPGVSRSTRKSVGRSGVAVDVGVHDDVVGDVAGGDEPFLAVDDEAVAAPVGPGADLADVGTGLGLRHRDAGSPLGQAARPQIRLDLLGASPCFSATAGWATTAQSAPVALPNSSLISVCSSWLQPLAPDLARMVDAVQAVRDDRLAQAFAGLGGQRSVQLQLDLVREEALLGECPGAALPVERGGGRVRSISPPGGERSRERRAPGSRIRTGAD